MYTMFFSTHDEIINVSLINDENVYSMQKESFQSHSVFLLPMIEELMSKNKVTFDMINKIVVVNGPGSFTGIRIGLSVAKTISYAKNIAIYQVSSLTCYLVSNETNEDKMSVIEDNKGYYISVFDKNNNSVIPEQYVENIEKYKYKIVDNKIDVKKILDYVLKNIKQVSPFEVKANYVKTIEVLK